MKKISLLLLLLFVTSGCFNNKEKAIEGSKILHNKMVEYKLDEKDLTTGKLFNFNSKVKNDNYINGTKIEYDGSKAKEGLIFIDADGSYNSISNLKINGYYCSFANNDFSCDKKNTKDTNTVKSNNKEYKVGEGVILTDGSKWHVINDSSKYSKYVTLLIDGRVDVNGDGSMLDTGRINYDIEGPFKDPDRIAFDTTGSKKYDVSSLTNIGYFVENNYKNTLSFKDQIISMRFLSKNEFFALQKKVNKQTLTDEEKQLMLDTEVTVKDKMENKKTIYEPTDEEWKLLMPHWLFNTVAGNFWLLPAKGCNLCTNIWDGSGTIGGKATTPKSLRVVITVLKSSVVGMQ